MAMAMQIPQVNSLIDYTTKTEKEKTILGTSQAGLLKDHTLSCGIHL